VAEAEWLAAETAIEELREAAPERRASS